MFTDRKSMDMVHGPLLKSLLTFSLPLVFSGLLQLLFNAAGLLLSRPLMELISTPAQVLPLALDYLRIYLLGVISMLIYNFGAAILRACGDTKRPLVYMTIAGVLNLIFVIIFDSGAAGVVAATIISETVSAILIIVTLKGSDSLVQLKRDELHIDRKPSDRSCTSAFLPDCRVL